MTSFRAVDAIVWSGLGVLAIAAAAWLGYELRLIWQRWRYRPAMDPGDREGGRTPMPGVGARGLLRFWLR
jgi:hypothetical protein